MAAALALAATPATPAMAQSGVTFDPNSPSAKEYAVPLQSARREAAGKSDGQVGRSSDKATAPAPLFGAGVGEDDSADGGPKGGSDSAAPRSRSESGKAQPSSRSDSPESDTVEDAIAGTSAVRAGVPDGGPSTALTIGAVALAVLLLGAVLGSIARRRST